MRNGIALLAMAVVLLLAVGPASAVGPPDNPFVGSWESDDDFVGGDGSHVWLQIGANGSFHLRDDGATVCESLGFGFVPGTISGFGAITDTYPLTFDGPGDLYCYTNRGRQFATGAGVTVTFDPDTGTLDTFGFNCWYRSGSDPAVCD